MKTGIIVALDREYAQMASILGGAQGRVGENTIVLHHSGIGKVNAAIEATSFIAESAPDCLVNTGVAGGLSDSLGSLDVVAAREVVYHDVWCGEGNAYGQVQGYPERFRSADALYDAAIRSGAAGGLVASGDFFVNTKAEADAILSHFPDALAVDMESGAIAQTCFKYGVPFLSIRIISDVAGGNHQAEYDNFWARLADGSFAAVMRFLQNLPSEI